MDTGKCGLVIGKNHKSAIGTIVERKSRYTLIIKLKTKNANEVAKMFSEKLNQLNPLFKKYMTYDNGTEMARHEIITHKTGMKIYFAHRYSSWERVLMKIQMDSLEGTFLRELTSTKLMKINYFLFNKSSIIDHEKL